MCLDMAPATFGFCPAHFGFGLAHCWDMAQDISNMENGPQCEKGYFVQDHAL